MTPREVSNERPSKFFPPGSPPDHVIRAKRLAQELEKDDVDSNNIVPATKQVSVTFDIQALAEIEVLARRLDVSRGSMIYRLTDLGVGVVFEELSEAALAEVRKDVEARYAELVQEAGYEYVHVAPKED